MKTLLLRIAMLLLAVALAAPAPAVQAASQPDRWVPPPVTATIKQVAVSSGYGEPVTGPTSIDGWTATTGWLRTDLQLTRADIPSLRMFGSVDWYGSLSVTIRHQGRLLASAWIPAGRAARIAVTSKGVTHTIIVWRPEGYGTPWRVLDP